MKKLILLRGVSGSGKSTFASFLVETLGNAVAYASDDFFMVDGKYEFDAKKLGQAHKWCLTQTENALLGGDYQVVVVHNTSTTNLEVNLYKDIADKCNAEFVSLVVENRHGNSNVHGVSNDKVESQAMKLLNNLKLVNGLNYVANKAKPREDSNLEVVKFLSSYLNDLDKGLEILDSQYLIKSKRLNGKILLKYHTFADKTPLIVRERRGIILSEKDLSVVSIPFEKFGNYGESYAANEIDFSKAKVVEKLDGSCLILYFDQINQKWCVQTLGQIEGEETIKGWGKEELGTTWAELFWSTFEMYGSTATILNGLDKNFSYIFELCTPYNRVVVQHKESKLYFLGLRNKKTLKEEVPSKSLLYTTFDVPKIYPYTDAKEILRICKEESTNRDEGFVIVDDNFNRIKMKSHQYVEEHYQSTVVTVNAICNVVFQHEEEEYLSIFPEFAGVVTHIKNEIKRIGWEIDKMFSDIILSMDDADSAKEFADKIKSIPSSYKKGFLFGLFSNRFKNGVDAIMWHDRAEWRIHKVDLFIKNSEVKKLVNANANTNSLK